MEQLSGPVSQIPPQTPSRKRLHEEDDSETDDSVVFVSETHGRPPCSLCNETSSPSLLRRIDFVMCMKCYQDPISSSYHKFWGHFFKLEEGYVVEVIALCRVNKDGYCRVLKTFPMGNDRDLNITGTGELKSSGFVAVLPRIDSKQYIFGLPETLFTHMSQNVDTPLFVSTICPDEELLREHCLINF